MIKLMKSAALALLVVLLQTMPVSAGIKFDFTATAGKVTETVSGWTESAKKYIEESETIQTLIKYGKGAAETAKQLKELKEDATGALSDVTGAVNSVKNTAAGAIGEVTGEINGVSDMAAGAVGSATAGVGGALATATSKTQNAQKLLALKNQKTQLESEYEAEKAARKAEFDGQIKSYNDNNESYRQMIAQDPDKKDDLETKIISNNEAVRFLTEQFNKRETDYERAYQKEVLAIDQQLDQVRNQAASEGLEMAKAGSAAFGKLFGGSGSAQELNQTIANNFIPAGHAVDNESVNKVKAYRQLVYGQDTIKAYASAILVKSNRYQSNDKADTVKGKVMVMEGTSAAISMDTELKIEQMKALLLYTKALIADMKMRSASDLSLMSVYQLRNPDKDVTQFNLDDYKYKKKKKSLKELAGSAKKAAGKISGGISEGKELLGAVKGGL